ncbi:hypothetical protein Acr_00g0001130 [Actinidia rufa]|uniref:Uncharacterized protein n=1 Tax=Actinidia rufa TaxID=165716 RepID=A0A7J0D8C2_9ERIC|nr:hypothetical protein Acr_00g0001130 [Actinidia rufa]
MGNASSSPLGEADEHSPPAAGSARAYSLESPNRSGFRKGVESRPAEAYQVDASSLDPGEEETQGLVALVKGRMERMASLPFDGSRRGIHFEGSMLLESCCTGASLARSAISISLPCDAGYLPSMAVVCILSFPDSGTFDSYNPRVVGVKSMSGPLSSLDLDAYLPLLQGEIDKGSPSPDLLIRARARTDLDPRRR